MQMPRAISPRDPQHSFMSYPGSPRFEQETVSPYFSPSQESCGGKKPTPKRSRSPSTSNNSQETDVHNSKKSRITSRRTPQIQDEAVPDTALNSPDPLQTRKKRNLAKRKKELLETNSLFFQRKPTASSVFKLPSGESAEGSLSTTGTSFSDISRMFANKPKKSASSKKLTTPKGKRLAGPGGQTFTPLELQVRQLRAENPGTVLMIEVGYKFKFFDEDAQIAEKVLGMTPYMDHNFLVAIVPVHRRDVYIKKLVSEGYRVGVVTQVETAALKKISDSKSAPFSRKLTRLCTAATFVDELGSIDNSTINYAPPPFACLIERRLIPGSHVLMSLISVCPSTGEVVWDEFEDNNMRLELETRLSHLCPAEILVHDGGISAPTDKMLLSFSGPSSFVIKPRREAFQGIMSYTEAFKFVVDLQRQRRQGDTISIARLSELPNQTVVALAHSIQHLSSFGIAESLLETHFFSRFKSHSHMSLASNTLANLEVLKNSTTYTPHGSLLGILDNTKTKFGARLLNAWIRQPLVNKNTIEERANAVEELITSPSDKIATIRVLLQKLPDLSRGLCRIQYGQFTPKELTVFVPALKLIGYAFHSFESLTDVGFKSKLLNEIFFSLPDIRPIFQDIISSVSLQGAAEDNHNNLWKDPNKYPEIDDYLSVLGMVDMELGNELEAARAHLKDPALKWTSCAGEEFLIAVSTLLIVPDSWKLISRTRNIARYRPPEVQNKLEERARAQESLNAECERAFQMFLNEIYEKHYTKIRNVIRNLAVIDCLQSLAQVGARDDYVRPQLSNDNILEIVDGRHPIAEDIRSQPFVCNTVRMGDKWPVSKIITGPNMGGKSSTVKMVALVALMAQIGSYVPAKAVKIGILDSILTRMGASDDISRGRSTFMVELSETSEILRIATPRSLVILDELGRGTSTFDGMAIAHSVMSHLLRNVKCKTLFVTHYPTVATELERTHPTLVENLHMAYQSMERLNRREIVFLYRLKQGIMSDSFGVECAQLAGIPENIVSVAYTKSLEMRDRVHSRMSKRWLKKVPHILQQAGINPVATIHNMDKIIDILGISI